MRPGRLADAASPHRTATACAPDPTGLTTSGPAPPPPAGVPTNLPPSTALPHTGLPSQPALPVPLWPAGPELTNDWSPRPGCCGLAGPCLPPLRPSATTGWASQTPGSSGVQSRCGARPLVPVRLGPCGSQDSRSPAWSTKACAGHAPVTPRACRPGGPQGPLRTRPAPPDVGQAQPGPQAGWGPRCRGMEPLVRPGWGPRFEPPGVGHAGPQTQGVRAGTQYPVLLIHSPQGTGRTPPGPETA